MKNKSWKIKHKEFNPKICNGTTFFGEKGYYKNEEDIRLDLGDRFQWAKSF